MILDEMGWNIRVLSSADFDTICSSLKILVTQYDMTWKGLYTVCENTPCIVIDRKLSSIERLIVGYHELGHHLLHSPYLSFFCCNSLRKSEYEAHKIAACALIPRPLVESATLAEIQEEYGYPTDFLRFRKRVYEHFKI